ASRPATAVCTSSPSASFVRLAKEMAALIFGCSGSTFGETRKFQAWVRTLPACFFSIRHAGSVRTQLPCQTRETRRRGNRIEIEAVTGYKQTHIRCIERFEMDTQSVLRNVGDTSFVQVLADH